MSAQTTQALNIESDLPNSKEDAFLVFVMSAHTIDTNIFQWIFSPSH